MIKAIKQTETKDHDEQKDDEKEKKEHGRIKQLIRYNCRADENEIIFENMSDERNIVVSDHFIAYQNEEQLIIRKFIDNSIITLTVKNFGRFIKGVDNNVYWITNDGNELFSYNVIANKTTTISTIDYQNETSIIDQIKQMKSITEKNQLQLNEYFVGHQAIIIDNKLYSLHSN